MARSLLHCGTTTNAELITSPFDRVFIRPETDLVMTLAMDLKHPTIDLDAIKTQLSSTLVPSHPRFSSLLVKDRWGRDWWRKTDVNVNDHLMVVAPAAADPASDVDVLERDAAVNAYLAELAVLSRHKMSMDKPLWEVHVLEGLACVVMRVHHAIGDGVSMVSLFSTCFGAKGRKKLTTVRTGGSERGRRISSGWLKLQEKGYVWEFVKKLLLTAVYEMCLFGRILGVIKDNKSVLSGCHGAELRPRTLVTVKFKLEDFRQVKRSMPGTTQNDVLMGVISSGLRKYLDARSPNAVSKGLRVTALVLANLRKNLGRQDLSRLIESESGTGWGNKIGLYQVPIDCDRNLVHPLHHVRKMNEIMARKKQSFEAKLLPVLLGLSISVLGLKMATWFYKRILGATTLLVSNLDGPREEIAIAGNPVISVKGNISSLPHQAISVAMVSYGREAAALQISVVNDIIPDPQFLAKCFEESLAEMKMNSSSTVDAPPSTVGAKEFKFSTS